MPNILKNFMHPKAEPYEFLEAEELEVKPDPKPVEDQPHPGPQKPIDYAKVQADAILEDARRQAEEMKEQARQEAEEEIEKARDTAKQDGYHAGYAEGMAAAAEQTRQEREKQAVKLEAEVKEFLDRAVRAQEEFIAQTRDELRDLAIAIGEKVIRISLKSSGEVISRMIMSAIEKRKRKEWVHIYISDCDAKAMAQIPPTLTAALSGLSDRVRIIPMAGDESGTLIVEMPDEIIDASASTQLANIRATLADTARDQERPGGRMSGSF